jgi:hypothetical protein
LPAGITTDGANLFVVENGNSTIRKIVISSGVVTTIAGSGGVTGSVDGTGAIAQFNWPNSITTDGTNLFVSDSNNNTIRKIVISSGAVTTIAGVSGSTDGTGAAATFSAPRAITSDGANLYVIDTNMIRKIVISTGAVTTIAGSAASGYADGTGTAARFDTLLGITTDGANLYVTDDLNRTIRKIVISTGQVTTMAGTVGVKGLADGIGVAASFNIPCGITTDGANLYVTDYNLTDQVYSIRKIVISTGAVTTIAGTYGVTGGTAAAGFSNPVAITTDGTNLFVADGNNDIIRKIVISTGVATTIAGTSGVAGSADGTGAAASFNGPSGITTDGTNLFVADVYNDTIRKIVISTGVVTTIAGTAGVAGSTDGTGASASFNIPADITTDGTSLYVADLHSLLIRRIR